MAKEYEKSLDFTNPNDPHAKQLEFVGSNRRVVDFGCWKGAMARELKERGCYVTGIEMDPQAAREAGEICDRIIVADLNDIDLAEALEGQKYDVGLFGDVIEHLAEPQRLLGQMRECLAPGGFVVLSVPNIAHASIRLMLLEGRFDYADTGILDDTHLKYFTRESIADLLESCGYMVEAIDWSKQKVSDERVRGVLDPLGLANLEEVVKAFSHWEAVAFQYVIKAFPAGEEARVQKLSEEKIQAERKLRELQEEVEEFKRVKEELAKVRAEGEKVKAESERAQAELDKVGGYVRSLETKIDEKDNYIASLEASAKDSEREIEEKDRRIEELARNVEERKSQGTGGRRRSRK